MIATEKKTYREAFEKTIAFKYFASEALDLFFDSSEIHTYENEDAIIVEGSKSPYFYAVLKGMVNVTVHDGDKEVYICSIGEGAIFGEAAIFAAVKRTASVKSSGQSAVLRIHRDALLSFIGKRPKDGVKFLMIIIFSLLRKLRDANQELAFERKFDVDQEDIDAMVRSIMGYK